MTVSSILDLYKPPIPLSIDGVELSVTSYITPVTTTNPAGYVNGSYPTPTNPVDTIAIEIYSTTDVHFRIGETPVATSNDGIVFGKETKKIICQKNERISFLLMENAPIGKVWVTALKT